MNISNDRTIASELSELLAQTDSVIMSDVDCQAMLLEFGSGDVLTTKEKVKEFAAERDIGYQWENYGRRIRFWRMERKRV